MLKWRTAVREDAERGVVLVLAAFLLIVLLGFAALAVDAANAWSNRRLAQNAADLAALAAVQAIPHTFVSIAPSADAETAAAGADFVQRNAPGASATVGSPAPGYTDVTVDVTTESANSFAPAIGASATLSVSTTATAHIEIHEPTLPVLPIGFGSVGGSPFRCMTTGPTVPGCTGDASVLGIRRVDTSCEDADATTVGNFINGVDHLVDTTDTGNRGDQDACRFARTQGHLLTMPTAASRVITAERAISMVEDGLVNGRLAGNGTALWDMLLDGLGGSCDKQAIASAGELDEQSAAMAACLADPPGGQLFSSAIGASARLGWGLDTASGTGYEGYTPIWVHTFIDDAGEQTLGPPAGELEGFTVYILTEAMLPPELIEHDPGGIDNLTFSLID